MGLEGGARRICEWGRIGLSAVEERLLLEGSLAKAGGLGLYLLLWRRRGELVVAGGLSENGIEACGLGLEGLLRIELLLLLCLKALLVELLQALARRCV